VRPETAPKDSDASTFTFGGTVFSKYNRGRAVQLNPMNSKWKPPGAKRLKLKCDELLSSCAVIFNLRRYTAGGAASTSS
jgi:hypothetical protein